METGFLLIMLAGLWWGLQRQDQLRRITFLSQQLDGLQLERHMQTLTQGYLRVLGEDDAERRREAWAGFAAIEQAAASQLETLAQRVSGVSGGITRMGRWLLHVPYIERLNAQATRDFRVLLRLHAVGLRQVVDNAAGLPPKQRAYQLSAELLLFQHSCHWYCKSRALADARLGAAHRVTHAKALESVSEATRNAYRCWLQT